MSALLRLFAIACLFAIPVAAEAQRTMALVIGIDNYSYVPHLDGARNDAADLTQALKKGGASHVVTLLDQDVTKANVTAAWQSLIAEGKPGDVIFLTYAGHGAQVPERIKDDEQDHLDEFWVLAGFNPKDVRNTWQETIFDNEISSWMAEAARHGLRVVLVADSCHAGGMARSVTGKVRFVDLGKSRLLGELFAAMLKGSGSAQHDTSDPNANADVEVAADPTGAALPKGITLLAATPEALPVPEVAIDGRARGALSWSVARAIEGNADRNHDGVITRNELEDYVVANVRMRSEALQTPVFTPVAARSADELIMPVQSSEQMKVASDVVSPSAGHAAPVARQLGFEPVLPVVVTGSTVQLPDTIKAKFAYQWDATKGIFKTPNGDVAAEHVSAFTVNDVVSKFILLDFLKAVGSRNPGQMTIAPQRSLYLAGDHIKFSAVRGRYANMVVFNLANSGEVQFLDLMINGEATGKQFLQEMQVVAPFGSDHLVTIASNEPLETIGRALQHGVSPKELLQILSTRIDGTDTAVAITPIYTRDK